MKIKHLLRNCILTIVTFAGLTLAANAQVAFWNFSETGTSAINAGSLGANYDLHLRSADAGNPLTDLHSADGLGVSGLAGDRALDLTAATGMNLAGPYGQPVAETQSDLIFSAMTISGWYRVAEGTTMTSGTSLFRNNTTSPRSGWFLRWATTDRLQFGVGNGTSDVTANSGNNSFGNNAGDWMFFAVSWDGANVTFYNGGISLAATPVNTVALATTMAVDTQPMFIGRSSSGGGAFDGLLDDLRIYNSALDSTLIEAIRVTAVPEPSSAALAGLGALALACMRRRSK
jgi:hypothetical protein